MNLQHIESYPLAGWDLNGEHIHCPGAYMDLRDWVNNTRKHIPMGPNGWSVNEIIRYLNKEAVKKIGDV